MSRLLPNERVLWEGRPAWRAVARDVLHIRWLALYFALMLIWGFASDRADGFGPVATLLHGVPLALVGIGLLAACAGFAWAIARTTTYTVTTERCILRYGVALTATLSIPLRRLAAVAVSLRSDGTGSIPLTPKPGARLRKLKLWPHVHTWQRGAAVPMLRAVPDAAAVAALISRAAAGVAGGVLHAAPAPDRAAMPEAILSPAGTEVEQHAERGPVGFAERVQLDQPAGCRVVDRQPPVRPAGQAERQRGRAHGFPPTLPHQPGQHDAEEAVGRRRHRLNQRAGAGLGDGYAAVVMVLHQQVGGAHGGGRGRLAVPRPEPGCQADRDHHAEQQRDHDERPRQTLRRRLTRQDSLEGAPSAKMLGPEPGLHSLPPLRPRRSTLPRCISNPRPAHTDSVAATGAGATHEEVLSGLAGDRQTAPVAC